MINQRLGNPCKEGNVMQEDTSQKAVAVAANQQNIFFMNFAQKYFLKNSTVGLKYS